MIAKGSVSSQVNSLSRDMEEYPHDMVYSPKDEAFILLLDSYDESDYPCTDMLLLPVSGNAAYLGTIEGNPQYKILHVSDNYVNAAGAKAPVLKSWDVTGSSTTGSFTVTLPDSYENGTPITGSVYLQAKIDDNDISGAFNGLPEHRLLFRLMHRKVFIVFMLRLTHWEMTGRYMALRSCLTNVSG